MIFRLIIQLYHGFPAERQTRNIFKIQLFCSESNQKALHTFIAWSIIDFFEIYSFTQLRKGFFYETRDSFPILADTHCNSFDALFLLHHPVWKSYERRRGEPLIGSVSSRTFKLGHSFYCQKNPLKYI